MFLEQIKNSYFAMKKKEKENEYKKPRVIRFSEKIKEFEEYLKNKKFLKLEEKEKSIFIDELVGFVKNDVFANDYDKYVYAKRIYCDLIQYGDYRFYDRLIFKLTDVLDF
jgi:hypothetical protein